MKKFLLLLAVVCSCLGIVACTGQVATYTDSTQKVTIGVNQEFLIALGSNPTTGYGWQESHDNTMLELVNKTYEPSDESENLVGGGGIEYFQFKALKTGTIEVTMTYKRPWEETAASQKTFTVTIE
ncbi:MAG: protease inhibitor I42 family protein [Dehalococcoidales bacterium]|nr:protease inhibitor I42 family protein [Dehalococcoidales bacterium]